MSTATYYRESVMLAATDHLTLLIDLRVRLITFLQYNTSPRIPVLKLKGTDYMVA